MKESGALRCNQEESSKGLSCLRLCLSASAFTSLQEFAIVMKLCMRINASNILKQSRKL
jgi:hypothetical protein